MLAAYDLPTVQRYAANFATRLEGCENGFCEDLDNSLQCATGLCTELRTEISRWAAEVFCGRLSQDAEVEEIFKAKLWQALARGKALAAFGEESRHDCVPLRWLDRLTRQVEKLQFLWDNWVSPARSTGPGPRTMLGDAAAQEIAEKLPTLPPLPADWQPKNQRVLPPFPRGRSKPV